MTIMTIDDDDRKLSCADEAEIQGDGFQRDGYISYLHKDLCTVRPEEECWRAVSVLRPTCKSESSARKVTFALLTHRVTDSIGSDVRSDKPGWHSMSRWSAIEGRVRLRDVNALVEMCEVLIAQIFKDCFNDLSRFCLTCVLSMPKTVWISLIISYTAKSKLFKLNDIHRSARKKVGWLISIEMLFGFLKNIDGCLLSPTKVCKEY